MRTMKLTMGMTLALALAMAGCPNNNTDSGTTTDMGGTDTGTTDMGGTDTAVTDMGTTDMGTTDMGMGFDLTLTLTEVDMVTPAASANVALAEATDLMNPVAAGMTDAMGMVTLNLAAAVNVPVAISSLAMHADTFHFLGLPVTMAGTDDILIIDLNTLALNYTLAGSTYDAGTDGTIAGAVIDATGMPVMGATVTSSDGLVVYLSAAGLPDPAATSTSPNGQFGVFDITMGGVMLMADDGAGATGSVMLPALADTFVVAGVPVM